MPGLFLPNYSWPVTHGQMDRADVCSRTYLASILHVKCLVLRLRLYYKAEPSCFLHGRQMCKEHTSDLQPLFAVGGAMGTGDEKGWQHSRVREGMPWAGQSVVFRAPPLYLCLSLPHLSTRGSLAPSPWLPLCPQ